LQATLESYEQLALGYLAVLRKEDGALIEEDPIPFLEPIVAVEQLTPEPTSHKQRVVN
jgi:hypothetical protein